jgi:NSS family neurotransmitter:Na+ symporter
MVATDRFSSRWGLVLASLGMAVGAGNIWRFPRVVSEFGGGAFMLAWLVALFVWSIPLLVIEFWWGRRTKRGPIGAFVQMAGPSWGWAGGFVALCCTAIMFYYAVVTGWCFYYLGLSAGVGLEGAAVEQHWAGFLASGWPVVCLVVSLALAVGVVLLGVRRGIERVSKVLVPSLFVLLVVAAVRAVTLPGAEAGLERLFRPNFHMLLDARVWLEAFSQSAWSTGAGWGLLLVYAGYARERSDPFLNACVTGLGNNAASLLAAFAIVPTIFALLPADQAAQVADAGNEGLAFVWMPRLFLGGRVFGGSLLVVVFFAALAVAALSSLIAMVELGTRTLIDLGLSRTRAALAIGLAGVLLGLPSAIQMAFFQNQDWVWGLGLLLSGVLFAAGTMAHGVGRMRRELRAGSDGPGLGRWFGLAVFGFIPVAFVAMMGWWLIQSVGWDPQRWWDPLVSTSLGTCLAQWGLAVLAMVALNRWFVRRESGRSESDR